MNNFEKYREIPSLLISGKKEKASKKVAIAITVYRRVNTLKEAIESCLNQTDFDDYSIVVCDDYPKRDDETEKYVTSLNNDKIVYYKNEHNLGATPNWNRCFEVCGTEYIVLLHDDDLLFQNYLSQVFRVLAKHPDADLIVPEHIVWNQNSKVSKPQQSDDKRYPLYRMTTAKCAFMNNYPSGILYRTKAVLDMGGFDENLWPACDWYFYAQAIENKVVYRYDKPLYIYRYYENVSFKEEVQKAYLKQDADLLKYLTHSSKFLKPFSNIIVSARTNVRLWSFRKMFGRNIDEKDLTGIPYVRNKFISYLYIALSKSIGKICFLDTFWGEKL